MSVCGPVGIGTHPYSSAAEGGQGQLRYTNIISGGRFSMPGAAILERAAAEVVPSAAMPRSSTLGAAVECVRAYQSRELGEAGANSEVLPARRDAAVVALSFPVSRSVAGWIYEFIVKVCVGECVYA